MPETTSTYDQPAARRISVATYAAIVATVMIMVLSAVTFALTPGDGSARPAYDPTVSLVGFADSD